jgi:peptide deformylase
VLPAFVQYQEGSPLSVKEILLLGNPKLYEVSQPVEEAELGGLGPLVNDLHDTLSDFRKQYGAGRAVAAPQIGVMKRLVYMFVDNTPTVFINPVIRQKSEEMMAVWDDCMSFPGLLVKVMRHRSCIIDYLDMKGNKQRMNPEGDLSELLQHEFDHLDGILAVSRAADQFSYALSSQREFLK